MCGAPTSSCVCTVFPLRVCVSASVQGTLVLFICIVSHIYSAHGDDMSVGEQPATLLLWAACELCAAG